MFFLPVNSTCTRILKLIIKETGCNIKQIVRDCLVADEGFRFSQAGVGTPQLMLLRTFMIHLCSATVSDSFCDDSV